MAFRKLLLRVMLWSLALAAVCGVLAVLFSGHETAWRVVGTMVMTAVAAGLMMWMSVLSEKPRTREAGFLGMSVVVAEWVLGEFLIWDVQQAFGLDYHVEEAAGLTMLFGAGTAIWAMLALTWIVIVHVFFNHFSPGTFPFNPSIFTGKLSRKHYQSDHPAEYELLINDGGDKDE